MYICTSIFILLDFNEDDPFGDLLNSDDDTSWAKPKRSSLKKKDDTTAPAPTAQTKSTTETDNNGGN